MHQSIQCQTVLLSHGSHLHHTILNHPSVGCRQAYGVPKLPQVKIPNTPLHFPMTNMLRTHQKNIRLQLQCLEFPLAHQPPQNPKQVPFSDKTMKVLILPLLGCLKTCLDISNPVEMSRVGKTLYCRNF